MLRLRHAILFSAVVAALLAAPGLAQTPPSTLTGELLTGIPETTSNCDPAGTSTISYSVEGLAFGPYFGTFTESGHATIGPQPSFVAVPVLTFTAAFRIESGVNRVVGTKKLFFDPFLATNLGFCTAGLRSFGVGSEYEARIQTPAGTFADEGRALVALNDFGPENQPSDPFDQFNEFFLSDLFVTVPVAEPPARVTGGGSIVPADAYFGFVVERTEAGGPVRGEWEFVNELTGDRVHSIEVSDLVVIENTAFFSFICDNQSSDAPCSGDVVVQDNGQGADDPPDTIAVTGVGFTGAAGAVDGDIEIHGGGLAED